MKQKLRLSILLISLLTLLLATACSDDKKEEVEVDHTYDGTWKTIEYMMHDSGRITAFISTGQEEGVPLIDTPTTLVDLDTLFTIDSSPFILDLMGDSLIKWVNMTDTTTAPDTTFKVLSTLNDWKEGPSITSLEQIESILPVKADVEYTAARTRADTDQSTVVRKLSDTGDTLFFTVSQHYTFEVDFKYKALFPGKLYYTAIRDISYTSTPYNGALPPSSWPHIVDTLSYNDFWLHKLSKN